MASRLRVPYRVQTELERAETVEQRRRVGQLIDRNFDEMRQGGSSGPAIIDMGDSTVYTGYSKPYYPLRSATLGAVYATVTAVGGSDTVANAYKNGTLLGIVTIPAGELISDPLEPGEAFTSTDYWQMLVTQAGSAASGLTFYGDFS